MLQKSLYFKHFFFSPATFLFAFNIDIFVHLSIILSLKAAFGGHYVQYRLA